MLGIRVAYGSANSTALWARHVLPTVRHNDRLRRDLLAGLRPVEVVTPSGQRTENAYVTLWPADSHDRMIARITRGLFRHEFGVPLAPEIEVKSYWLKLSAVSELAEALQGCPTRSIGHDQFKYSFGRVPERPECTFWLYLFHGRHAAAAWTGPGDIFPDDPADHPFDHSEVSE